MQSTSPLGFYDGMDVPSKRRKKGRPRKKNPRSQIISTYFTEKEAVILRGNAKKAGMPLARFIRKKVLNGEVRARFTEEELLGLRKMVSLSNSITDLVKIAEKEGSLVTMLYFKEHREKIDLLLNEFYRKSDVL